MLLSRWCHSGMEGRGVVMWYRDSKKEVGKCRLALLWQPTLVKVSVLLLDLTHPANLAFMHSCIHQIWPCNLATFWCVPLLDVVLFKFHTLRSNLPAHDPLTGEMQQVNNTFEHLTKVKKRNTRPRRVFFLRILERAKF